MNFRHLLKAMGIALLLMLVVGVLMLLAAWTKGLFLILFAFCFIVWIIYQHIGFRERMAQRKKARGGW
jgi:uncharacterized membrane protein